MVKCENPDHMFINFGDENLRRIPLSREHNLSRMTDRMIPIEPEHGLKFGVGGDRYVGLRRPAHILSRTRRGRRTLSRYQIQLGTFP